MINKHGRKLEEKLRKRAPALYKAVFDIFWEPLETNLDWYTMKTGQLRIVSENKSNTIKKFIKYKKHDTKLTAKEV